MESDTKSVFSLDKLISYLQKYLIVCNIVYFTFILPLTLPSVKYHASSFDSEHFKTHLGNVITSTIEPPLTIIAVLLLILSGYRVISNRKLYKRQFIVSTILALLIIWGTYLP